MVDGNIRHSHFRERAILIELDLQCNTFFLSIQFRDFKNCEYCAACVRDQLLDP